MSCNCQSKNTDTASTPCFCDQFSHPPVLQIGAGLTDLPRQMAGFPEFRRAMIRDLQLALQAHQWRANRIQGEFGIMLLEMWAYVADVLAFYDQVIAQESYLRTAKRSESVHKIIARIGYQPKPAIAAKALLTAMAQGNKPVFLPKGMGFRSMAFADQAPQVFELDEDTWISPLTNHWQVTAPQKGKIVKDNPQELLVQPKVELKEGQWLLLTEDGNESNYQPARIRSVTHHHTAEGQHLLLLRFYEPLMLKAGTSINKLELHLPIHQATLLSLVDEKDPLSISIDRVKEIYAEDVILLTKGRSDARWFRVESTLETYHHDSEETSIIIGGSTFKVPAQRREALKIVLDRSINDPSRRMFSKSNWSLADETEYRVRSINDPSRRMFSKSNWPLADGTEYRVWHHLVLVGSIVEAASSVLASSDQIVLKSRDPFPEKDHHGAFILSDRQEQALLVEAKLNASNKKLELSAGTNWTPDLKLPVEVYGNVLKLSRGESVNDEILGSGNAALANQTFKLKKKPLTYLLTPGADRGIQSTLKLFVNGISWSEVPSFYGKKPSDQVYLLRQNESGDTLVIFGDGIRGQRLPTGNDNVRVTYRIGAGKESPPGHHLNQLFNPVVGLLSVDNPIASSGGADAESPAQIRTHAPKTTMFLGRAVSILDMEAIAKGIPGVDAAQASWFWSKEQLRKVVQIWYVGAPGLENEMAKQILALSDPLTPIQVQRAFPIQVHLVIGVQIQERYDPKPVLDQVRERLLNPQNGLFAPAQMQVGKPLFRSQMYQTILSVEGTIAVPNIVWNQKQLNASAVKPGAGAYFELKPENLVLNTTA